MAEVYTMPLPRRARRLGAVEDDCLLVLDTLGPQHEALSRMLSKTETYFGISQ